MYTVVEKLIKEPKICHKESQKINKENIVRIKQKNISFQS